MKGQINTEISVSLLSSVDRGHNCGEVGETEQLPTLHFLRKAK